MGRTSGTCAAMLIVAVATALPAEAIRLPFHKGGTRNVQNTDCLTSSYAPAQSGMETVTNTCTFPLAVLWASAYGKGGYRIAYWDAATPWRTGESHVQTWQLGAHDAAGKDRWRVACDLKQPVCMANLKCLAIALHGEGPLADPAVLRDLPGNARKCGVDLTAYGPAI